jgi:hypothetical protein
MKSSLFTFIATLLAASTVFADLLQDMSYQERPGESCSTMIHDLVRKSIPEAANATVVIPASHITTTQGTDLQVFVSIVDIENEYYTVVSSGSYSCDYLRLEAYQKLNVTP